MKWLMFFVGVHILNALEHFIGHCLSVETDLWVIQVAILNIYIICFNFAQHWIRKVSCICTCGFLISCTPPSRITHSAFNPEPSPTPFPLLLLLLLLCVCFHFTWLQYKRSRRSEEEWTLKQKMIIVQKHRDKLFGLLWFLYHFRQVLTTHTRTPTPGHVCVWPCLLTFILSCCQFFFLFTTNTNSSISVCENSLVMYLRTNTHTCTHDITFYLAKDERNFTHFHGLRIGGIQHNGNIKFLNCKITVAFEVKVCVSVCVCVGFVVHTVLAIKYFCPSKKRKCYRRIDTARK